MSASFQELELVGMTTLLATAPSGRYSLSDFTTRLRCGSTISHIPAPNTHRAAATRKNAAQPKRWAIHGVSCAVTAPPIWPPMFMNPETDPDDRPTISAVPDHNALTSTESHPAPPAIPKLANDHA